MYGGKVLAKPVMREYFHAFVLIPIAPFGSVWDMPTKPSFRPKAIHLAMSTTRSVMKGYNINPDKVYITGYSMGGVGTYSAIEKYKGMFAAAAPMDGAWDLGRIEKLDNIPIHITHGQQDNIMGVGNARDVVASLKASGREVYYTEYPNYAHGAWEATYSNPDFWKWLFVQEREDVIK